MEIIKLKIEHNKKTLLYSLFVTFIFGLIAHSYMFLNSNFSHDSINEFNSDIFGNSWKISLGRFIVPVYHIFFRSHITLPWLIGLYSLLWISFAVFLIIKIFNNESKLFIFFTAGILTTNITVSATAATYLHDLDSNMFAMLCAVISVYLWKKYKIGFLFGSVFLFISLGIYQSYVSVAITLILFFSILELINEAKAFKVIKEGIKSILMIFISGILYLVTLKIVPFLTDVPLQQDSYNTLDKMLLLRPSRIFYLLIDCVYYFIQYLTNMVSPFHKIVMYIVIFSIALIFCLFIFISVINKKIRIIEKLLILFLTALIPFGVYFSYILSNGYIHDLMLYSIWLIYLFVILLSFWYKKYKKDKNAVKKHLLNGNLIQMIAMILVLIIISSNIQVSNILYLKKDLEFNANFSLFTRILYRLEDDDEYIQNETPVVFVGMPSHLKSSVTGFEKYKSIIGNGLSTSLFYNFRERFSAYFDYFFINEILLADEKVWLELQTNEDVKQMPSYPDKDCIKLIDNIMVVKLGD